MSPASPALNANQQHPLGHTQPPGSTLLDQRKVCARIERIARALTRDPHLQQDLTQEALLRFWRLDLRRPGQKLSWYFKGCRNYLQDLFRRGRSFDALKRSSLAIKITVAADGDGEVAEADLLIEDGARSLASADDILAVLFPRLNPTQQSVLRCLSQGYGVQETAIELGISHQAVAKARRKIRSLALRMEIAL